MKKTCATCGTGFEVTPKDSAFYAELKLPSPQSCPDCRSLLRCSHRNERSLSKRTCSLCRKEIVAMYTADAPFPVYCHDCFFSDRWNPLDFGRPYREDVPFFGQLKELLNRVPRLSIINKQTENSEYSNYSYANKNCYLTFGSHYEEDCLYGAYSTKNKDCVDCLWSYGSELLYESLFSKNCNRSIFLDHCADCSDCAFSIDLKGCAYCCFCSNMNHKKYCMFNEQLTKEEYGRRLAALRLETGSGLKEAGRIFSEEMPKRFPVRAFYQIQSEDCEGSMVVQCKNLRRCFFVTECEDCTYSVQCDNTFHAMDMDYMGYDRSERCYQTIGCQGLFDCLACNACWHGSGLKYCQSSFSCHDCFGCISLQQKKCCILNHEYPKEEYHVLAERIKKSMENDGMWGTFFPASLTPFAYNESMAQDWFPLTEAGAKKRGYRWKTGDEVPDVKKIINAKDLPEKTADIPDDVLNWAIRCEATKRPYRIVKKELEFHRTMNLPLPHFHPEERHRMRLLRRHGRHLWKRPCGKCGKETPSVYAPERPEIVYCEECYLKEVY
ncbi:MAG: hypothetical protein PHO54_00270 [Candidatus Peribacteraceae bacterium]|nr:hypothetical protein [Candidatus Peribacteraceae bacterium]